MAGNRRALVTGASSGIGLEIARVLARDGIDLVLVGRDAAALETAAAPLRARVSVEAVAADLSRPDGAAGLLAALAAKDLAVDILVNNAGSMLPDLFLDRDWPDQAAQITLLVTSVAELCHGLGRAMAARGWGVVLNVASIAAFTPVMAGATLYPAAKSFVVRFTRSLALEWRGTGLAAIALCPGLTRTGFHRRAGLAAITDRLPASSWQSAEAVAEAAVAAIRAGRSRTITTGWRNRLLVALAGLAPAGLGERAAARHPLARRAPHRPAR